LPGISSERTCAVRNIYLIVYQTLMNCVLSPTIFCYANQPCETSWWRRAADSKEIVRLGSTLLQNHGVLKSQRRVNNIKSYSVRLKSISRKTILGYSLGISLLVTWVNKNWKKCLPLSKYVNFKTAYSLHFGQLIFFHLMRMNIHSSTVSITASCFGTTVLSSANSCTKFQN
jgi:hypothetical protein